MSERKTSQISSRKQPKQARSTELVASIMSAAAQVLEKEGAGRFTTARVAERAGVSIGSLYQYFPNKAAILFQLQNDEWRQTTTILAEILADTQNTPLERLRVLVHSFIRSECEEAEMRVALNDAAPLYRDAPEAREGRAPGRQIVREFIRQVLPDVPEETCARTGDLILTILSCVGKEFSERTPSSAEITDYADALADMFCTYLNTLEYGKKI
jgi:AcrR family transcriptional regulator